MSGRRLRFDTLRIGQSSYPPPIFESELDTFIEQVIERLRVSGVEQSNLRAVWTGVSEERRSPHLALARKFEALLGSDPDEADPKTLERMAADAEELSAPAIEELAAEHGQGRKLLTADELRQIAEKKGCESSPRDTVRLQMSAALSRGGDVAAWRLGANAAQMLRKQEGLGDQPITDKRLSEMAGVLDTIVAEQAGAAPLSFSLDTSPTQGRTVLRPKWHAGRRFELARFSVTGLLGQEVASCSQSRVPIPIAKKCSGPLPPSF